MQGEDGRDYVFLLKGHEDLRQDERVMQLFGQVLRAYRCVARREPGGWTSVQDCKAVAEF